jgi:hypothetical protein
MTTCYLINFCILKCLAYLIRGVVLGQNAHDAAEFHPPLVAAGHSATHILSTFLGDFFSYYIQHCFLCRPSDSTVPTDAGIEPWTVATSALAVRRSNHSARSRTQLG